MPKEKNARDALGGFHPEINLQSFEGQFYDFLCMRVFLHILIKELLDIFLLFKAAYRYDRGNHPFIEHGMEFFKLC